MTRKLEFVLIDKEIISSSSCSSLSNSSSSIISDSSSSSSSEPPEIQQQQQQTIETDSTDDDLDDKSKIITNIEELKCLKARSRIPIDIQLDNNTNNTSKTNLNELISKFNKLNTNQNQVKLRNSSSNENKKYFSFLTTNKLFVNNRMSCSMTTSYCSSSNSSSTTLVIEPKLKIYKNQLIDENDENARICSSSLSPSSNSSESSNFDNRCSILSEFNTNNNDDLNLNTYEQDKMKDICEKVIQKQNNLRKSIGSIKSTENELGIICKKKSKILTVLFDYDAFIKTPVAKSVGKSVGNSSKINVHKPEAKRIGFSVKKGETVKVIRDYDENFYLVANCANGKIGFIPKEYTVDLKEVKNRYIQNSSIQIESNTNNNLNYSSSCFKLTKL